MILKDLPGTERNFKIIFRGENGKAALKTGFISGSRKVSIRTDDLDSGLYSYELFGKTSLLKAGKFVKS